MQQTTALALAAALIGAGCAGRRSEPLEPPTATPEAQAAPVGPPALRVVETIPLGLTSRHLALSGDGQRLLVSVEGGSEGPAGVLALDLAARGAPPFLDLGAGYAFQLALAPRGELAFLAISRGSGDRGTTSGDNRVEVIDARELVGLGPVTLGGSRHGPIGLALTPDGSRVLVTNRGVGQVDVIEAASRSLLSSIAVGPSPIGIALSPDGALAYVSNRDDGTVSVVDLQAGDVRATVETGLRPSDSTTAIAVTPDGRLALVTHSTDSRLAVLDLASLRQLRLVETNGASLGELAFLGDGRRALVTSMGTDELLLLNVAPASPAFLTVEQALPVGDDPNDVVVGPGPDGERAYVVNTGSRDLTVVAIDRAQRSAASRAGQGMPRQPIAGPHRRAPAAC